MRRRIVRFTGWAVLGFLCIGLGSGARAQETFCQSQLDLVNKYLGPLVKPPSSPTGTGKQAVGMAVVTLMLGEGPCFFAGGEKVVGAGPPDANTIFELASVTKVFTTAILAQRSKQFLQVDSAVAPYLPSEYQLKTNEQEVTFQQLATFTGGFTWDEPPGFKWRDGYTQEKFVEEVNKLNPKHAFNGVSYLPTKNDYSNGSVGLLGQVLMFIDAGSRGEEYHHPGAFSNWITDNLAGPLDMPNTAVEPAWSDRAQGYKKLGDGSYEPLPPFPWVPWGPAGALRSNLNDMERFLEANICAHHLDDPACAGLPRDILDALALAHTPNTYDPKGTLSDPTIYIGGKEGSRLEQAWAWIYRSAPDPNPNNETPILEKGGAHAGFGSWIAINPHKSYGIVILVNTGHVGITTPGRDIIEHTHAP